MSSVSPEIATLDTDIALAECARAALIWCNSDIDRSEALQELMRAMAIVAKARGGSPVARNPADFLRILQTPPADWLDALNATLDEPLLAAGEPTAACEDLVAEAGPDPEAELTQRQIGITARNAFRSRPDGPEGYRHFRRFLIEHPCCSEGAAMQGLFASGLSLGDVYECIPVSHQDSHREVAHPCPVCGWPMRVERDRVTCDHQPCRNTGAAFQRADVLRPLGAREAPSSIPVRGHLRLRRGIWRYTLLPGLIELDLEQRLTAIPYLEVTLWPDLDDYDLDVSVGETVWRVDVKDWSNPRALARQLRNRSPLYPLWIVLPDRRRNHLPVLRDQCRDWHFTTVSQFLKRVRKEVSHG